MYDGCFKINVKFKKKIKNIQYMYDGYLKINNFKKIQQYSVQIQWMT